MLEQIWPESFTHWKVMSAKNNAVLCEIFKIKNRIGLFWQFESPNSEFAFLPAEISRDENGCTRISDTERDEISFLLDFGRKVDPRHDFACHEGLLYRRAEVEELYSFRVNFKEGEAKAYAELVKQNIRRTPDDDDTIYVHKIEPPLTERLKPVFALTFCLVLVWFFKVLIFGK